MFKKIKYEGLPPVLQVHKEIDKVMRFFRQIPYGSRAEVASLLCFGIIAGVSQGDPDEGKNIFDKAKSKFLETSSKYKSEKAKARLEEQKKNYQLHDDGVLCVYEGKDNGMSEEDEEKYLNWSLAECTAVEEFARMSLNTLQMLQALFEQHAKETFEIHYDATYMASENMPQAPFDIYCKSGELMDSFRRLAFMLQVAIGKQKDLIH